MNWQKTAQKLRTWLSEEGLLHLVTYTVTQGVRDENDPVECDIVSVWWSGQVVAMEYVTKGCGAVVVTALVEGETAHV